MARRCLLKRFPKKVSHNALPPASTTVAPRGWGSWAVRVLAQSPGAMLLALCATETSQPAGFHDMANDFLAVIFKLIIEFSFLCMFWVV